MRRRNPSVDLGPGFNGGEQLPEWPNNPNPLKNGRNVMVRFDEENASSAVVGVRYRNGKPATPAAEGIPDCREQDLSLAFAGPTALYQSETSDAGHDRQPARTTILRLVSQADCPKV